MLKLRKIVILIHFVLLIFSNVYGFFEALKSENSKMIFFDSISKNISVLLQNKAIFCFTNYFCSDSQFGFYAPSVASNIEIVYIKDAKTYFPDLIKTNEAKIRFYSSYTHILNHISEHKTSVKNFNDVLIKSIGANIFSENEKFDAKIYLVDNSIIKDKIHTEKILIYENNY